MPGALALDRGGRGTLVAIGNFDGVHRGHRAVLERAVARARGEGLIPVVLTFHPHPAEVLGRPTPAVLTPLARKVTLLRGVDPALEIVVHPFDAPFAAQTPEAFAAGLLAKVLSASARVALVGFDRTVGGSQSANASNIQRPA